ncbi:MAG TPA: multidrug effflux MFS transporter [Gammaproteobacteria bacterium]|nr:multidrug effflux MFS transporter [Gammaproteobacteria bacterium]
MTAIKFQNTKSLSTQRINLILWTILLLYPLLGMGIDLIAPSLPAISHDLGISNAISKNLIALYLIGYAAGNFLIGFLSDALGRRKLLMVSLFVFTLTSLLPIFLPTTMTLLISRLLQGFSLAGFGVIARASVADLLTADKLKQVAVLTATMWGIGPIVGPFIGGYLQYYFGWQACFYFFSLYSFLGLAACIFIVPETHHNRQPFNLQQIKLNFITITSHPLFMGMVIIMGTNYSLLIVFNALGPFLIQNSLGFSPLYFGHIALYMGLAFLIGTYVCRRLIKVFQPEKIIFSGIGIFLLVAAMGVILAYVAGKNMTVVVIPSLLLYFACGILYPASMARGLAIFQHLAGSSAAVMNLLNLLITSLTAFAMSLINPTTALPMACIYLVLLLFCALAYWLLVHKNA